MWFSQFLLIWYSNIRKETAYFEARWTGAWGPVFAINFIVNWERPLLMLCPREGKRSERSLLRVAFLLLAGRLRLRQRHRGISAERDRGHHQRAAGRAACRGRHEQGSVQQATR